MHHFRSRWHRFRNLSTVCLYKPEGHCRCTVLHYPCMHLYPACMRHFRSRWYTPSQHSASCRIRRSEQSCRCTVSHHWCMPASFLQHSPYPLHCTHRNNLYSRSRLQLHPQESAWNQPWYKLPDRCTKHLCCQCRKAVSYRPLWRRRDHSQHTIFHCIRSSMPGMQGSLLYKYHCRCSCHHRCSLRHHSPCTDPLPADRNHLFKPTNNRFGCHHLLTRRSHHHCTSNHRLYCDSGNRHSHHRKQRCSL